MKKKPKGIYTRHLLDSAERYGIRARVMPNSGRFIEMRYKNQVEYLLYSSTRLLSRNIANVLQNKAWTNAWLKDFGFPVTQQRVVQRHVDAEIALKRFRNVVVKPLSGSMGQGITLNVTSVSDLKRAFKEARRYCDDVLIEKMHTGFDIRLLVIGKQVFGVQRHRAQVVGDGKRTVEQLRNAYNRKRTMWPFKAKDTSLYRRTLRTQGCTPQSVPPIGKTIYISETINIHQGGFSEDITDQLPVSLKRMAIKISKAFGTPIMGIDWLTQDIRSGRGVVLEINEEPGLMMHEFPDIGTPRPVTAHMLALLFPTHPKLRKYR